MINVNGQLVSPKSCFTNRGFKFGDAVFETLKIAHAKLLFWEDHYLRLMASMRILRMEIPMHFTMEFLKAEILKTVSGNHLSGLPVRIRLTVYRNSEGYYLPESNEIAYAIEVKELKNVQYTITDDAYVVDLFKDYHVNSGLLSTLKTTNRAINIVGSIYAQENNYDNCLLLNEAKNVIEALNGNIFMVVNDSIKTPPVKDGCINGILRKQLIKIATENNYVLEESSISSFELQNADELFITNVIMGIQPVTKYRKKEYGIKVASQFTAALNVYCNKTGV